MDHNPLLLDGICTLIRLQDGLELVGTATSASEAVRVFRRYRPRVVLMDLDLPEEGGIRAIREMREIDPTVCVLGFLTHEWDDAWGLALRAGARACVTKDKVMLDLAALLRDCF